MPSIQTVSIQSDNAGCYQSRFLTLVLGIFNYVLPIKIERIIHTETQDGKCDIGINIYACIHTHIHTHIHTYTYIHAYIHVLTYSLTHIYIHLYIHKHIYLHLNI